MGLLRRRNGSVVTLLLFFVFLTVYFTNTSTNPIRLISPVRSASLTPPNRSAKMTRGQQIEALARYGESFKRLNLTRDFEFARQCLKPRQRPDIERRRASVFDVEGHFMVPSFELATFDSQDPHLPTRLVSPGCQTPLTVDIPASTAQVANSDTVDTSTLMLGMATSLERLVSSLPEMAQWLAKSSTPLLVILRDQSNTFTDAAQSAIELAHTLQIQLTLIPRGQFGSKEFTEHALAGSEDETAGGEAQSNFGLARAFIHYKTAATKWYAVIDDDTFFVSLPAIIRALEPYSPDQPHYIGALSERHLGMGTEGFKAWGGAGIFMTLPLITVISDNFDTCIQMAGTWGDALWRDCIALTTSPTVQLTPLSGLHQLDMFPSVSGWYESGPWPLLTVHHWKSWHSFPIPEAHRITSLAGPQSLFARFAFRQGGQNLVLTNGYSLVEYPDGIPDLGLVENTFTAYPDAGPSDAMREYRFSLGRLRPKLVEGVNKFSWILEHSVGDGGVVRQFYVRRGDGPVAMDSVLEVDWLQ